MLPRACIVTTYRNAPLVLDTFIAYHLGIGFAHLFLFADDPGEPDVSSRYPPGTVTFIRYDEKLARRWQEMPQYGHYGNFIGTEVMARQTLNVEVAIRAALAGGYDWMLHIDVDELFYPAGGNATEHFAELDRKGIQRVSYANHEGIPEAYEVGNYFAEVSLFKRNFRLLDPAQQDLVLGTFGSRKGYFRFYSNGKSAARLHPGLLPSGVHAFAGNDDLHADPDTGILHYSCCGFGHFLDKYKTLGDFASQWFGTIDIARRLPAHVLSREVVKAGDEEVARRFYRIAFLAQNSHAGQLLGHNVYFRASPLTFQFPQPRALHHV